MKLFEICSQLHLVKKYFVVVIVYVTFLLLMSQQDNLKSFRKKVAQM